MGWVWVLMFWCNNIIIVTVVMMFDLRYHTGSTGIILFISICRLYKQIPSVSPLSLV